MVLEYLTKLSQLMCKYLCAVNTSRYHQFQKSQPGYIRREVHTLAHKETQIGADRGYQIEGRGGGGPEAGA